MKKMKGRKYTRFFLPGMFLFVFTSCTQFFSTSLAPWAARDPASLIPPVTASNVKDLIIMAENNPDLSLAVLKGIRSAVNGASGKEKAELQAAALQAAVNASSLGPVLLGNAGDISELADDSAAAQAKAIDIMLGALNSMKNLNSSADTLAAILPDPSDTAAFDAFLEKSSAEDLAMAGVMLLAAAANREPDPGAFINGLTPSSPPPSASLAVRLAEEAMTKIQAGGGSGGMLEDILIGLKLV
jgi:hypothetical protein